MDWKLFTIGFMSSFWLTICWKNRKMLLYNLRTYLSLAIIFKTPFVWRKKNIWKIAIITPWFFINKIKKFLGEE